MAVLGVCLSSVWAEDNGAARVISLTGQVSVLHDSYPWVLNVGDQVKPSQIVVTGADGFAIFQVSDGSTFEVFPNSRTIFRESPSNWKNLLDVIIGRVKIHIQKLTGGLPNPTTVRTPTAVISVRGTVFDVVVEDENATTMVSVEEGQVVVRHLQLPGKARVLNPGDSITIYKDQPLAKTVDKGSLVQGSLRAAAQVFYEILYRTPRSSASGTPVPAGGGGGTPLPGDRGGGSGSGSGSGSGNDKGGSSGGEAPPPPPPPPPPK